MITVALTPSVNEFLKSYPILVIFWWWNFSFWITLTSFQFISFLIFLSKAIFLCSVTGYNFVFYGYNNNSLNWFTRSRSSPPPPPHPPLMVFCVELISSFFVNIISNWVLLKLYFGLLVSLLTMNYSELRQNIDLVRWWTVEIFEEDLHV